MQVMNTSSVGHSKSADKLKTRRNRREVFRITPSNPGTQAKIFPFIIAFAEGWIAATTVQISPRVMMLLYIAWNERIGMETR